MHCFVDKRLGVAVNVLKIAWFKKGPKSITCDKIEVSGERFLWEAGSISLPHVVWKSKIRTGWWNWVLEESVFLLLLITSYYCWYCILHLVLIVCFVGFLGFDFFFNAEINRNEDMKHVVGVSFSVKLETGTFNNLLYYEILLAQLLLPSTCTAWTRCLHVLIVCHHLLLTRTGLERSSHTCKNTSTLPKPPKVEIIL